MKNIFNSIFLVLMSIFFFSACNKNENEKTIETGTVTDKDGNTYATVKIGDNWWMAENLRVTVYRDSSVINKIESTDSDSSWASQQIGACTYTNDTLYGLLYNYSAVTDSRGIAPDGWHIATDEEWMQLEMEIGMSEDQVNLLGWRGTNEAEKLAPLYSRGWPEGSELFGTDAYKFNALPGGCRLFNGILNTQNNTAFWWTMSSENSEEAWYRYMDYNQDRIFRQHTYKGYGMSIRCVKDK
jgi:uncharacterized protein (TIGR02145 family)